MAARAGALEAGSGMAGPLLLLTDVAASGAAFGCVSGAADGVAAFSGSGLRTGAGAATASTLGRAGAASGLRGVSENCLINLYTLSDWRFDRSIAEGSEADFAGGNGGSEGCCAWAVKLKLMQQMAA